MMNDELQARLLERFPWTEAQDDNGIGQGYLAPCFCGDGWFQLIWSMFEEFESLYSERGLVIDLVVVQVYEKYAGMHMDYQGGISGVDNIVDKYENLSEETCEVCGSLGEIRKIGDWLSALCDGCYRTENDGYIAIMNHLNSQLEWDVMGLCHGCGKEGIQRDMGCFKLVFCDPCLEADTHSRMQILQGLEKLRHLQKKSTYTSFH